MVNSVLLKTFNDWYAAYSFYCVKENIKAMPKHAWSDMTLFSTNKLSYSHSVYNLSTKQYWSNTYQYVDSNKKIRHIKVKDGVVTDWYTSVDFDSLTIGGKCATWLSNDLDSGTPTEYYSDDEGTSCCKYDIKTNKLLATVVNVQTVGSLPEDVISALEDFPYMNNIFSYGRKEYGTIVEFTYTDRLNFGSTDPTTGF